MSFPPPPPGPPPYPPGPPAYPPFAPPPRRGRGARIALVAGGVLLVIALLGGVAVGSFLLAGGGEEDRAADTPTGARTSTGPASASPSDSPSAASSSAPESGPSTPYTPTDDTDDDIHNDVKVADFPGDWDFKLGDVEQHATLVSSVDHPSCAPVEEGTVLTRQRCTYAAQWVFNALGGKVRLTHLFLVFDTERHAKAAQGSLKDKDLDLPAGSLFPSFAQGQWASSVYGNIVAVTIGTSKVKVSEKRLTSLVNYMNADYKSALLFKF